MVKQTEDVLKQVRHWPASQRVELIHALLNTLDESEPSTASKPKLSDWLGLVASDKTPPTDDEVKQMIHEHRMRKYG